VKLPITLDVSDQSLDSDYHRPLGRLLVEMGAFTHEELEQLLTVQRCGGGRLGDIAVSRGLVSPLMLLTALKKQRALPAPYQRRGSDRRPPPWKPLGQILVERRLITPVQLQQALVDQHEDGGFIGELLLMRGWITVVALVDALGEQIMSSSSAGEVFHVRELEGTVWTALHSVASFEAATDFVFDDVLSRREPQGLAIVHRQGGREEIAWSYGPELRMAAAS